jgi:hypothetical protein
MNCSKATWRKRLVTWAICLLPSRLDHSPCEPCYVTLSRCSLPSWQFLPSGKAWQYLWDSVPYGMPGGYVRGMLLERVYKAHCDGSDCEYPPSPEIDVISSKHNGANVGFTHGTPAPWSVAGAYLSRKVLKMFTAVLPSVYRKREASCHSPKILQYMSAHLFSSWRFIQEFIEVGFDSQQEICGSISEKCEQVQKSIVDGECTWKKLWLKESWRNGRPERIARIWAE